jgi:hypothetical protein
MRSTRALASVRMIILKYVQQSYAVDAGFGICSHDNLKRGSPIRIHANWWELLIEYLGTTVMRRRGVVENPLFNHAPWTFNSKV